MEGGVKVFVVQHLHKVKTSFFFVCSVRTHTYTHRHSEGLHNSREQCGKSGPCWQTHRLGRGAGGVDIRSHRCEK